MRKLYRHALRRQAEKADQKTIKTFRYLWKHRHESGCKLGDLVEKTIVTNKRKRKAVV